MNALARVAVAATAVLLLSGCSSMAEEKPKVVFDVPGGGVVTQPGTDIKLGDTALVAFPETKPTAALELKVESITPAKADDFKLYKIPENHDAYYVKVAVKNRGPAAVELADGLPIWLAISGNTLVQPSAPPKNFKPCKAPKLQKTVKANAAAKGCLLFFTPAKSIVNSVDFQPGLDENAIRWKR